MICLTYGGEGEHVVTTRVLDLWNSMLVVLNSVPVEPKFSTGPSDGDGLSAAGLIQGRSGESALTCTAGQESVSEVTAGCAALAE